MDDERARAEEAFLPPPPPPPPELLPVEEEEDEDEEEEEEEAKNEDDELVGKAQRLIEKITSSPENPNPVVLHALASIFETQESRFMEENGHASNNSRSSHNIGRLGNLVRENDDFFELISSTYLSEARYPAPVQAAVARLLLSCSVTWISPHVFDEAVMDNIKDRVMDESAGFSGEDQNPKREFGRSEASDSQMLKTYSTGLLAYFLAGGGPIVEDVLTSRLSAKLMRYLRIRVLGETSAIQKDSGHINENKNASSTIGIRNRDESRSKARQVLETSHFDDSRIIDEKSLDDQSAERDRENDEAFGEDHWVGGSEPPDNADGDDRWNAYDVREGKTKFGEFDENGREDSARRKHSRVWAKSRGKGKANEGSLESEQTLTSPGSGSRFGQGRSGRDKCSSRTDTKKVSDSKKFMGRNTSDFYMERGDNDDCYKECRVGTTDIRDLVKKAVIAAEAEAQAANAPEEAIKAAGDAAAEVVKSAALEEFKNTNNEEAAVLAASKAASTVIDAANAVEVSRSSISAEAETGIPNATEPEINVDVEKYFIPDAESLAKLREKYCIQCLESLGEYVEVLGPVLHEKGVDVCIALLQKNSKQREPSEVAKLLPDILKLICALVAHRKFAALFVDRGGMQKLLAVPRVAQTYFGLSSCLFAIGSLQGIMERVCALPSDVVYQLVELILQLLRCPQDQARKNAALFFSAAFVFRAVLDALDSQEGLQKLLRLLNDAASVRSGVNSGALGLSNAGSFRNERPPSEVLTSSEKQIAYHTCVALRQYFRAHLLLLVDSIRPNKSNRGAARNAPSVRAAYKPLDISNEAIDAIFLQLQKDRKLGAAFVRTRWPAVEKFLSSNGHITMLELCQALPVERYLHDLLQYALSVLHIVTLVPSSRKMIVSATLSNNRVGIAVILDAASVASSYVDPEIIQPALNVLVNLVCPPPSISNKPPLTSQGQQSTAAQTTNGPSLETRERNMERNVSDRAMILSTQIERGGESATAERGSAAALGSQPNTSNAQAPPPTPVSGLVGDRRITLGAGAGCAGLATQLEQGYHQAREAVRANNGIKVLLHLLQPRIYSPPAALDCLRALACRVLLGLARDPAIAHILTKLQVGKKLSELIRDSGSQTNGTEQGRWQAELSQAAIELIGIVTNSGRASTLAATDAATPTLRRIERAAIAAATPITYHSKELLLLIHEHLQASGLGATASTLLNEAKLAPLPSLAAPSSLAQQVSTQESSTIQFQWPTGRTPSGFLTNRSKLTALEEDLVQFQWPTGRTPSGFLTNRSKLTALEEDLVLKFNPNNSFTKKKQLLFSPSFGSQSKSQAHLNDSNHPQSVRKIASVSKQSAPGTALEPPSESSSKPNADSEAQCKTPTSLPLKRKSSDSKEVGFLSSTAKRIHTSDQGLKSPVGPTPTTTFRKSSLTSDAVGFSTPTFTPRDHGRSAPSGCPPDSLDENQYCNSHMGLVTPSSVQIGLQSDPQTTNTERLTLDSLVVQYLKHQHRQCPVPITTLPPLSLLHPHVCPEPRRSLEAPSNVTARLAAREFKTMYGGVHGNRRDRQFVYSRFRPWRTCRDDSSAPLTCIAFLRDTSLIAVGSHSGELKIFDSNSSSVLETCHSHQSPMTVVQSYQSRDAQLLLSSSAIEVKLWDASSVSGGPMHPFDGCKAARFSNSGDIFAALSSEPGRREILMYDIQTCQMVSKLSDTLAGSTGRGSSYSSVHFNPSDIMLLWNGVLWDRRQAEPIRRFDQFTDYGGGGFHPAGNEVIINSEVWDLRKFRLLRSVPSLDQTTITFNARGDVIYANLRRNIEDVMSAFHTRRAKHPLFSAFRTVDAINYSDIATIPVDRCVLDFATEPTDSFVGLITLDDQEEMFASARVCEIGRRRPTDDDSDPDDAESDDEDDDDDDDDDDADIDTILGPDLGIDGDSDGDDLSNDDDDSVTDIDDDDDDDDGDFIMDETDFGGRGGILDIFTEGDDDGDDSQLVESFSSSEDDDFVGNGFGY